MKMMNIYNKCQTRIIMSVFHWNPKSKSASFYVISKNSTKNLKLKIQPLGFSFLHLPAYARNDVLLLEPQGHIRYVFAVFTRMLFCYAVHQDLKSHTKISSIWWCIIHKTNTAWNTITMNVTGKTTYKIILRKIC